MMIRIGNKALIRQYRFCSSFGSRLWSSKAAASKSSPSYKSHEYPWATEPPIITRTTAKEAVQAAAAKEPLGFAAPTTPPEAEKPVDAPVPPAEAPSSPSFWSTVTNFFSSLSLSPSINTTSSETSSVMAKVASISGISKEPDDPFDDKGTLSPEEVEALRLKQVAELANLKTSLEPVTKVVPSYVPPTVSAKERPVPETIISTLPNGVRVVTQETYGHVSTIGVVSQMGSRFETPGVNSGMTHLLELLAFGGCNKYRDSQEVNDQLRDWLGTRFAHTAREQSMYGIDLLRPYVPNACEMLADLLLNPKFYPHEIDQAKEMIQFLTAQDHLPPEFFLSEAIQAAAFGTDQQLGQPHAVTIERLPFIHRQQLVDWWQSQMIDNPQGLVVGGAGIEHDLMVRLAEQHFGHLQQDDTNRIAVVPSVYRGGFKTVTLPPPVDGAELLPAEQWSVVHREKRLTRVVVGLEIGGWHSDNLVPVCVLQTLLGGGSSFSAGGPGKGMYSRLYRQVLNRFSWAESVEAFTAFQNEAGLVGITGRSEAAKAPEMVKTICLHLQRLAVEPVSEEELDRARNMLRNEVMSQMESRFVLFEDMARQVLTFGKREHMAETAARIDAVTAKDIQALIAQAILKPPTVAAVGVNVQHVPPFDQICQWLRRGVKP
jgi:mitochondrial-processing peptidase subunit alpha